MKFKKRCIIAHCPNFVVLFFSIFAFILTSCTPLYSYEVCDNKINGKCERKFITEIQPSFQTFRVCAANYIETGAKNECENVPINRLLLKGGTDKKYCNNAPYLKSDYLDNWWNAEGLIEGCEMPPKSNMQFIFKAHNQTIYSHTGTIQISIKAINYNNNYLALQVFTGEDNDNNNLPDSWVHCGNVDGIKGKTTRVIQCSGTNLKFIKLVNAEWNPTSIFLDNVEVLKI